MIYLEDIPLSSTSRLFITISGVSRKITGKLEVTAYRETTHQKNP